VDVKKAKKQKITNTCNQKKTFSCYTINVQGLTKREWLALLAHPAAKDPDAMIITEHHLPFTNGEGGVGQTDAAPMASWGEEATRLARGHVPCGLHQL